MWKCIRSVSFSISVSKVVLFTKTKLVSLNFLLNSWLSMSLIRTWFSIFSKSLAKRETRLQYVISKQFHSIACFSFNVCTWSNIIHIQPQPVIILFSANPLKKSFIFSDPSKSPIPKLQNAGPAKFQYSGTWESTHHRCISSSRNYPAKTCWMYIRYRSFRYRPQPGPQISEISTFGHPQLRNIEKSRVTTIFGAGPRVCNSVSQRL